MDFRRAFRLAAGTSAREELEEEFAFHNLKMYPYDNDEFDEEERALNNQIKVCAVPM